MKKTLLKTVFICLEITLLCGLYSFKTPDGVKSQHSYRTSAISNDTVITPDGQESECVKEVVDEGGKNGCTCTLKVKNNHPTTGQWELQLEKSSLTDRNVQVTFEYKLYSVNFENGSSEDFVNSSSKIFRCTEIIQGDHMNKLDVRSDQLHKSVCVPVRIVEACFVK